MEEAHSTSFAYRKGFRTQRELEDWVITYYAAQLAYYANSATTESQIKLQYATNAGGVSSWNDLRTINTSDLTNGQYNYIRFNNAVGRYLRVYGNSGASGVLAINELKVQEPSDSVVANTHGHLGISNSDTSLNLDGT